jgi:hypothetical protein
MVLAARSRVWCPDLLSNLAVLKARHELDWCPAFWCHPVCLVSLFSGQVEDLIFEMTAFESQS